MERMSTMATERKIRPRIAAIAQSALLTLLALTASVSYSQTDVRDIDNAARQPFQAELRRLRVRTSGELQSFQVAVVPSGKRLVIEHVSFRVRSLEATAPGSAQPRFETSAALVTKVNGVPAEHELIVNRADVGSASFNVASQPVRVYADPGSLVLVNVDGRFEANAGSPLEITHLTVSGHLVDVP
jgi:hypothetical protein